MEMRLQQLCTHVGMLIGLPTGMFSCKLISILPFMLFDFNCQLDLFACRRGLVIYINAFSGDATVEFPSTLQMARGGVRRYFNLVLVFPCLKQITEQSIQL